MKVDISVNELVDRLRVLQAKLVDQNEHSDALFVGFAIQAISELPSEDDHKEAFQRKLTEPFRWPPTEVSGKTEFPFGGGIAWVGY